jgi:hypothetical protein
MCGQLVAAGQQHLGAAGSCRLRAPGTAAAAAAAGGGSTAGCEGQLLAVASGQPDVSCLLGAAQQLQAAGSVLCSFAVPYMCSNQRSHSV